MNFDLKDRWVLITGASSGFGAAAAVAFGALGAKLLLGARRIDRLEQVATACQKAGAAAVEFHTLDVASTPSVEKFLTWTRSKTQKLHVLINNAGGALGLETVAHGKDEDWEAMIQSNLLGVLRVTRAALPLLPHDDGASIINIGSMAAHQAYEGAAVYGAAKLGALHVTRALRLELNGTGIRVSSVDPGLAETEFSLVRFKGDKEQAKKPYEGTNPLVAQDISDTLVWVATRPPHVNVDNLLIRPVDQAAMHKIYRRK